MNPAENTQALREIRQQVETHCMCAKFIEEPTAYVVYYPAGMWPNGCKGSFNRFSGRAAALRRMLEVMERHWKENGIQS